LYGTVETFKHCIVFGGSDPGIPLRKRERLTCNLEVFFKLRTIVMVEIDNLSLGKIVETLQKVCSIS
jgi:hypothetical protein